MITQSNGHLSILQVSFTNTLNHHVFGAKIKKKKQRKRGKAFFKIYLKQVLFFFFPSFVVVHK
jgi:hypothetical protein